MTRTGSRTSCLAVRHRNAQSRLQQHMKKPQEHRADPPGSLVFSPNPCLKVRKRR